MDFAVESRRRHRPGAVGAVIVALAMLQAACATAPTPTDRRTAGPFADGGPPPGAAPVESALPAYRVARGDELSFRFVYTPELNTTATIRSDGRLSLPLIGDLVVEGLTVPELAEQVQHRLAGQVKRPQVVINLTGAGSQRIFIGGEVLRPGVQPLVGPLTVLQAVMAAEGLKDSAQPAGVLVLRRGSATAPATVLQVNLEALLAGRDDGRDVVLAPYDVVVVPRSGIASVGVWVDQYLRRTLPFSLGFTYSLDPRRSFR